MKRIRRIRCRRRKSRRVKNRGEVDHLGGTLLVMLLQDEEEEKPDVEEIEK